MSEITVQGMKMLIRAETKQYSTAINRLAKHQEKFAAQMVGIHRKQAKQTEKYNNRMSRSFGSLRRSMRLVNLAAAAYLISWIGTAIRRIVALQRHINGLIAHFITFRNRMKVAFDFLPISKSLNFVLKLTKELGLDLAATRESFAKFAVAAGTAGLSLKEVREIFVAISKAIRVHNLGTEDTRYIFLALEQMASKGKVSYEELRRQLGERLPGAIKIAADAMGVTQARLDEMLRNGELYSDVFLPRFAKQVEKVYAKQLPEAVKTATAEITRMKNEWRLTQEVFTGEEIEESIGRMAKAMGNFLRQIRGVVDGLASVYSGIVDITAAMLELVNKGFSRLDGNFQMNMEQATASDMAFRPGNAGDLNATQQNQQKATIAEMETRGVYGAITEFNRVLDKATGARAEEIASLRQRFKDGEIEDKVFMAKMAQNYAQIVRKMDDDRLAAKNALRFIAHRREDYGLNSPDNETYNKWVYDSQQYANPLKIAPFTKDYPFSAPDNHGDPRGYAPTERDYISRYEQDFISALENPLSPGSMEWIHKLPEDLDDWTEGMIAATEKGHEALDSYGEGQRKLRESYRAHHELMMKHQIAQNKKYAKRMKEIQEELAETQKKMIESYRDIGRATLDMIRGVDNGFDRLLLAIQEKFLFKPAEDLLTKAAASIGNAVIAGWGGGANPTGFGGGFGRDPNAAQLGGTYINTLNVQTPTDINTLTQFGNGMG